MGRSLWEDEAHLAFNFLSRGFGDLLKPLDNLQAAPPLYLLTTKLFTIVLGYGEKALRALPFLASIFSLPLFYFIIYNLTQKRVPALIGFLLFSVNLTLVYFSSELKTYGIDVAMYLIMVWLFVSQHKFITERRNLLLALAGSIFILYSNVTFIILACIAISMIAVWIRNRRINSNEIKVLLIWAIVFSAYYFLFVFHHPYQADFISQWTFAFPPRNIFTEASGQFLTKAINDIAFDLLLYVSRSYGFGYLLLFTFIVAICSCIQQGKYQLLLFSLMPILLHFGLAMFKVYPFWYRFILYTMPGLMILIAWGTYIIAAFLSKKIHLIAGVLFALTCCAFYILPSIQRFPLWYREIKPALKYINSYPPSTKLYITTPKTLYQYYYLTGKVQDSVYEALEWNIPAEKYFESVAATQNDYLLLHAADTGLDGYGRVVKALKEKRLVLKEFSYGTYTVSLIRSLTHGLLTLDYKAFEAGLTFELNGKKVVALWEGTPAISKPIDLPKGKYEINIVAKGTPAKNIFPHLQVYINNNKAADFFTTADYAKQTITIDHQGSSLQIKLLMDNDLTDSQANEDRNAFIAYIMIEKIRGGDDK